MAMASGHGEEGQSGMKKLVLMQRVLAVAAGSRRSTSGGLFASHGRSGGEAVRAEQTGLAAYQTPEEAPAEY